MKKHQLAKYMLNCAANVGENFIVGSFSVVLFWRSGGITGHGSI
ncbi:hypothetical protein [Paenibacillus sp. LHD-38]|nr:hypothetical protein [Paenibacillus sp. LHD-38]MDQ8739372.1 hypothetical protein [Paenibacillus sp. LHD-38]